MSKSPLFALAAVAALSLAACDKSKPEELDTRGPDPQASALANAAPVELPPAIAASVTFRCQPGNTLMYVNFYQGDKQVILKDSKEGMSGKTLKAANPGDPYTDAEGNKLTGNAKAATIALAGGSTHSCKA